MTDLNIFYLSIVTYMILSAVVIIMLRIQIDISKKKHRNDKREINALKDTSPRLRAERDNQQLLHQKNLKIAMLQDELKYFQQSEKELQLFIIHLKEKLHKEKRKK